MVKKQGKKKPAVSKEAENPLFEKRERNYRIGGNLQPKRDLYRYVRWPEYIQLQRKRRVLLTRLKVPPPINQFRSTLDKSQATALFRLLLKYRPESRAQKKLRLEAEAKGEKSKTKPFLLKYGLSQITQLVESNKAKLVVIAHDVDPIELVLWLPALCRSMSVPYVIVKGKSRLGLLTHKKTCTAVALTEVKKEDLHELELLVKNAKASFNDNPDVTKWGGGVMGSKSIKRKDEKERLLAQEAAKKAGF
jgi:Ribosomal protein HS6-type (S12/L30/L7a)